MQPPSAPSSLPAQSRQPARPEPGDWALVTGASSGIGEAFAHAVAARGWRPLLIARRAEELARVAAELTRQHGVECATLALDLAAPDFMDQVEAACGTRTVSLVISNAAINPPGAFLDHACDTLMRQLDVNCRASLLLARAFLPRFERKGRGGLILVASTEAFFGVPYSAAYSATKAFVLSLGEALWGEFAAKGVDVLVLAPGATDTPLLASRKLAITGMPPREVAEAALQHLGKGPCIVPGTQNRWTFRILRRLPRAWSIRLIAPSVRKIVDRLRQDSAAIS